MCKKTLSVLLVILTVFAFLPYGISADAIALSQTEFEEKLAEVKELYPEGSQQYEWSVNGNVVGWQCHGYARWLSFYVWGVDFANGAGKGWSRYDSTADTTYIDRLVPGDVLRYRTAATKNSNHSIFVTRISGDTVYFTDCNSDGANTIKWERSMTKAKLEEHLKMPLAERDYLEYGYIAHYDASLLTSEHTLTIQYNGGGGTVVGSENIIYKYTVTESTGLNLRSDAGTNHSVLTAMPVGTVFTVSETKADADGKYIWGKTTYNGIEGWCVISMHWTTVTELPSTKYYVGEDNLIYLSQSHSLYTHLMTLGTSDKYGFANASSFGLTREGYTFLGWSKTPQDEVIYNQNDAVTPETIFPELENGDMTVTVYARWKNNNTVESIEIVTLPTKTEYSVGSQLDTAGLQIKVKYSDATEQIITEGFTITGFDPKATGTQLLTVTYEDKSAEFEVTVKKPTIGDVDSSGVIDLADITVLAQYVAEWDIECNETALDVDGSGDINLNDVVHLARYVANWDGIELG